MEDRVIPRDKVISTITLSTGRSISGVIQIDLDTRLSDFMNLPERFMVIHDRNEAMKIINKDYIVEISQQ